MAGIKKQRYYVIRRKMNGLKKAAVIGVGYVGASITYALAIKGLAHEIVMIEQPSAAEKCLAELNDIRHGMPYMGMPDMHFGTYEDLRDCDLIIVTAGRNRRPGESRLELTADNYHIVFDVAEEIKKYYTQGVVLVVTNPIDILTQAMTEWLGLPDGKVFGTGCLLDSSRLICILADHVGLSSDVINAHVIGEHGDGQIVLWSKATVAGLPIGEYCRLTGVPFSEETRKDIEDRLRIRGAEIIKGKGRTHYGIATCVCYIADAILNRRPTVVSVSSVLRGEYGIEGTALSLPCVIGANGIERRLEDKLDENEHSRLKDSVVILNGVMSDVRQ